MKTFNPLITSIFTILVFASCNTPAKKVENAEQNVVKANQDLIEAKDEYLTDIETYKKEADNKIADNNKIGEEFKIRIEKDKKEAKIKYTKELEKLDQKNSDLKMKMDNYKAEGKEQWDIFKTEFNHDMDELKKSYENLTKNTGK